MPAIATKAHELDRVFSRLERAGLPSDYVKRIAFPSWWKDEIASDEAGLERAMGFIHRTLGISIDELWDRSAPITCPAKGRVHFKKAAGHSERDFRWARCIGYSAAEITLSAMPPVDSVLPADPCEVRRQIRQSGHQWVDLRNLLDYLWDHGVPVLHIDSFPGKKMVGMAARIHDRAAIVLSKNHPYPSLSLFDLAHELGHILNGDLAADDILLDEHIDRKHESDGQEIAATQTGAAVLTGERNPVYSKPFFGKVAPWAQAVGEAKGISPGVVAQNLGFHRDRHWLGNGGCKLLEPNQKPVVMIRQMMMGRVDMDALSDEEAQFLMRVGGQGASDAEPDRQ